MGPQVVLSASLERFVRSQITVVAAVVIRGGTVLAAQRGPSMSLAGLWELPGGKVEPGELPESALVREIWEELLCTVSVGERVMTTTHEYEFGVVTLTTYYSTILDGDPHRTEHADLRWVPLTELRSLDWAPADIPALDQILRDHDV